MKVRYLDEEKKREEMNELSLSRRESRSHLRGLEEEEELMGCESAFLDESITKKMDMWISEWVSEECFIDEYLVIRTTHTLLPWITSL